MIRMPGAALLTALLLPAFAPAAFAAGGCLEVANVPADNFLYVRARASAKARVVERLAPDPDGIIRLEGPCTPQSVPWERRWCLIVHTDGPRVTEGWVKAQFAREIDCPSTGLSTFER